MTVRRRIWAGVTIMLVLALMALASNWISGQFRVDRCLDAGGAWNSEQRVCEGSRES